MNLISRNIGRAAVSALALALLVLPAAAKPSVLSGPLVREGFPGPETLTPFAREALGSLSTFQLSNGIPVILRRNDASPVQHLQLVIRGGARAATPATAGLELLALNTMRRASTSSSYEAMQSLLDETTAGMSASVGNDYSSYSLTGLDRHFARLLPVWASTLVSPLLAQEDFDQVRSEAMLAVQNKEKDPWAKTGRSMNEEFFAGHPYSAYPEGTRESLEAATLEKVKAWHGSLFSSDRMFIVAAGNFDASRLKADLDKALGAIPNRRAGAPAEPPALSGTGRLVKVEFPQSKGIAYLRADFPAPSSASADYMATGIGMKMLSDLLMDVVREKYGAVYTADSYIRNNLANYGSVVIYKTSKTARIKAYIDEAVDDFAIGKVPSTDTGGIAGGHPRMAIEEALPAYKAQFESGYFEALQTNAAVAGLIAQSVVIRGDCRAWLLDQQLIKSVSADEVRAAASRYLLGQKLTWVVLGPPDLLVPVVEADFARLGTK